MFGCNMNAYANLKAFPQNNVPKFNPYAFQQSILLNFQFQNQTFINNSNQNQQQILNSNQSNQQNFTPFNNLQVNVPKYVHYT